MNLSNKMEEKLKTVEADFKVATTSRNRKPPKAVAMASNHANELKAKIAALEKWLAKLEERGQGNGRGGAGGGNY